MSKKKGLIDDNLAYCYQQLKFFCSTPNLYRQFIPLDPDEQIQNINDPLKLATYVFNYFNEIQNDPDGQYVLTVRFDLHTIHDLLMQPRKENRLVNKVRDSYLHFHSFKTRHNLRALFYHFDNILANNVTSINGLSLDYITMLFAPIIIKICIDDSRSTNNKLDPVLRASLQTAIFQTINRRLNEFFNNIEMLNQIVPDRSGRMRANYDEKFVAKEGEAILYYKPTYKTLSGETKYDEWFVVKTRSGIGYCPSNYIIEETDATKDTRLEGIQRYHDIY